MKLYLTEPRPLDDILTLQPIKCGSDSRSFIADKARDLMEPVLGKEPCARLIDKVLALDGLKDIRELRPLLQLP